MDLKVHKLLNHRHLEVHLRPGVNVVTGKNSAGKTSLATILAALATETGNPLFLSAAEKSKYVTRQETEGHATLRWDGKKTATWYPLQLQVSLSGAGKDKEVQPLSIAHAVGLVDFLEKRPTKERAKVFESLFPPPSPASLLEGKLPDYQLESVVQEIERNGWDSALAIYEHKRREAKDAWQKITGAGRYSDKKGANWVPGDWRMELAGASPDSLQADLQNAKDVVAELVAQEAISQDKIAEARKVKYEEIPAKEAERVEAHQAAEAINENVEEMKREHTRLSELITLTAANIEKVSTLLNAEPTFTCPVCNTGLVECQKNEVLKVWKETKPEELAEAHEQREALRKTLKDAQDKRVRKQMELDAQINRAEAAHNVLMRIRGEMLSLQQRTGLADAKPTEGASQLELNKSEEARDAILKDVEAKDMMNKATRAHNNVVELDATCQLLSAQGARWQQGQGVVGVINKTLANMSELAGWPAVVVDPEYAISYNDWPVALCAENERLKVQILLQLAFARVYKPCRMIVLDALDKLYDESWDGLVNLLNRYSTRMLKERTDIKIVLCGTNLHERHESFANDEEPWHIVNISDVKGSLT